MAVTLGSEGRETGYLLVCTHHTTPHHTSIDGRAVRIRKVKEQAKRNGKTKTQIRIKVVVQSSVRCLGFTV